MAGAFSKILILVIIAVLVAGGFFAWQYFGTPQEKAEMPQGIITDETADWQTYRNEQYGFEIKYPPDWKFDAGKRIITFCGPESWQKSGDCLMAGMGSDAVITLRNDSLDIVRDNFCKENPFNMFCGKILTQKDLMIEGSDGKIFETDADNGTLAALWKKVPTDDRMYELSADELNDLPQHRDVFNQMLSTFKFLK